MKRIDKLSLLSFLVELEVSGKDLNKPMIVQRNQRGEIVMKKVVGSLHKSMGSNQAPFVVSGIMTTTGTQSKRTTRTSKKTTNQKTSGKSVQKTFQNTTFSLQDFLVRVSALLEKGKLSRIKGELSFMKSVGLFKTKDHAAYSLKTLKDCYQHQTSLVQDSIKQLKEKEKERLRMICEESKKSPEEAGKKFLSLFTKDIASYQYSVNWMNWGMMRSGKLLTANISGSRRTGRECSLSDILEVNVTSKYFLSEKMQERFRKYLEEKR